MGKLCYVISIKCNDFMPDYFYTGSIYEINNTANRLNWNKIINHPVFLNYFKSMIHNFDVIVISEDIYLMMLEHIPADIKLVVKVDYLMSKHRRKMNLIKTNKLTFIEKSYESLDKGDKIFVLGGNQLKEIFIRCCLRNKIPYKKIILNV